jgi:hypothetical protein
MGELAATLAAAVEHSGLGQAARGTTWLYPIANLSHVVGAALLVGGIAALDVHILRRGDAAGAIARAAIPVAAFGLVLQIPTGVVLFSAEATALVRNPAFLAKVALILVGLVNVAAFHWRFGEALRAGALPGGARPLAAVSLLSWLGALLAGRAIAYL